MDPALKNAAENGNINALYLVIREDPKVLEKIDEIPFIETPLHVAAAAGQTEFALEIMMLKPSFANKLDPEGLTPLLLAMRNDKTELVMELLGPHKDLVLAQGRKGMNPLHYAAETGNLNLLCRFLRVCPKLIEEVTSSSETALHIALKNDMFDAFLVLVGWLRRAWFRYAAIWQHRLLNWKDVEGNTVLHIASSKNHAEVVCRLLEYKVQVNNKNSSGLTALDLVPDNAQGANPEIRKMLLSAGALPAASLDHKDFSFAFAGYLKPRITINEKFFIWFHRQKMQISIDMRNLLLVVAVLLVTIAYQGVLSPPGGFWQDNSVPGDNNQFNTTAPMGHSNEGSQAPHFAGTVTMAGHLFHLLLVLNSLTFYIPLLLIILVIPHGIAGGLLIVSVVLLFLSYSTSISVITPFQGSWFSYFFSFSFFLVLNLVLYLFVSWKHQYLFLYFFEIEELAWPTFYIGG